jgi:hypothetical protein
MRHYNSMFALLTSFQTRFTAQSGLKSPDDYFI